MVIQVRSQTAEVYLDNNATTVVLDSVAEVVQTVMQNQFANPSSSHIAGVRAKHIVETSRDYARQVLGAGKGQIIFTSGATEGIQTAIVSALINAKQRLLEDDQQQYYLLYGATEHKAVPNTLIHWNEVLGINASIEAIPVDQDGLLDMDFIAQYASKSLIICTMAVNNETGVFQDLAQIEQVIRQHNQQVAWMVDCVQALGKRSLDIANTSIDYAPFSGHKLYAPKGVGLLYVRENRFCTSFIAGGGQENGIRSGTENTSAIAGFGKIFALLLDEKDDTFKSQATLEGYRQRLVDTLRETFPNIVFNHNFAYSVPTTINFSVKGLSSKEVMDLFDAAAIRVSAGSACSSKTTRSFVLDAMQLPDWQSSSAIRLSFGPADSEADIEQYCQAILNIKPALQQACLVLSDAREVEGSPLQTGIIQLKVGDTCSWVYIDPQQKSCVIIDAVNGVAERISRWVRCQSLTVKGIIDTHQRDDSASWMLRQELMEFIPATYRDSQSMGWPNQVDGYLDHHGHHLPYLAVGQYQLARLEGVGMARLDQSLLLMDNGSAQAQVILALVGNLFTPNSLISDQTMAVDSVTFHQSVILIDKLLEEHTIIGCGHDHHHQFVTSLACLKTEIPLFADLIAGDLPQTDDLEQYAQYFNLPSAEVGHAMPGMVDVGEQWQPYTLASNDIRDFLEQHPHACVVDMRECYECDVSDIQSLLALKKPPINIPLSKLAEFVCQNEVDKDAPLLLICRTGNRSLLGCKVLMRLGFHQVYNIGGGIALYHSKMY